MAIHSFILFLQKFKLKNETIFHVYMSIYITTEVPLDVTNMLSNDASNVMNICFMLISASFYTDSETTPDLSDNELHTFPNISKGSENVLTFTFPANNCSL